MFSRPTARSSAPGDPETPRRDPAKLWRLLRYVRPYLGWLVLGIVATLFSAGLSLVFPKLFGNLIDASFLKRAPGGLADTGPLDRIVLLLLGVFAVVALFTALQTFLISRVGVRVVADLRRAVFSHLLTLSPRFFAVRRTGELTSRLTSDVSTVQTVVSSALAQLLSQVVTLIGGVTLMVLTSFRLSLFTLAVIPMIIGTAVVVGLQIRKAARDVQDKVAAANASAEEAISGVRVVQSFTAETLERARYGQGVEASFQASLRRIRLSSSLAGIMTFLAFGSLAGVLWYGGRQVLGGDLTPGKLVSFLFYALAGRHQRGRPDRHLLAGARSAGGVLALIRAARHPQRSAAAGGARSAGPPQRARHFRGRVVRLRRRGGLAHPLGPESGGVAGADGGAGGAERGRKNHPGQLAAALLRRERRSAEGGRGGRALG